MTMKHKPFEKLVPEWQHKQEEDPRPPEKRSLSERPTLPAPKKESVASLEVNSFDKEPSKDGIVECHFEKKLLGRVDAVTSIGGPGSKYKHNEDAFVIHSDKNSLVVAVLDGAGGSGNGELASRIGSEAFLGTVQKGDDLLDAFDVVSQEVQEEARGGYLTATALHAVRLKEGGVRINVATSGDSKVLTIRNGERLPEGTTDFQNMAQLAVTTHGIEPWEYYNHKFLAVITGGLGIGKSTIEPPIFKQFDHMEGDVSILASDGLWDSVSEYEVIELSKEFHGKELEQKLFELILERNGQDYFVIQHSPSHSIMKDGYGGGDNVTIVVVG